MHFQPLVLLGALATLSSALVIRSTDSVDLLTRDADIDLFSRDTDLEYDLLARDFDLEDLELFPRGKAAKTKTNNAASTSGQPYKKPSSVFKQDPKGKHDTPVPKGCSGSYCDHTNKVVHAAYGDNLNDHADHKLSHPGVGKSYYPHSGTPAQRKEATRKQRYEATKNTATASGMARDEFPWASVSHSEKHTSVKSLSDKESRIESSVMNQANAQAHKYGYPIQFKDNRTRKRSLSLEDYILYHMQ